MNSAGDYCCKEHRGIADHSINNFFFVKKDVLLYLHIPVCQNTEGCRADYFPLGLFGGHFSHPKGLEPFYSVDWNVLSCVCTKTDAAKLQNTLTFKKTRSRRRGSVAQLLGDSVASHRVATTA